MTPQAVLMHMKTCRKEKCKSRRLDLYFKKKSKILSVIDSVGGGVINEAVKSKLDTENVDCRTARRILKNRDKVEKDATKRVHYNLHEGKYIHECFYSFQCKLYLQEYNSRVYLKIICNAFPTTLALEC